MAVPVGVFVPRTRCLLPLRRRDATLYREGGTVGARNAQRGSVAANLGGCYALHCHRGRIRRRVQILTLRA